MGGQVFHWIPTFAGMTNGRWVLHWIPVFAGMTNGGWVLHWIPVFAGMTNGVRCCTWRSFFRYSAPQGLDPAAPGFAVQPPLPGAFSRGGRPPDLPRYGNASDQFLQALQGLGSILLPGPVFAGLDDHHTVLADAVVPEVQEALFIQFRQ